MLSPLRVTYCYHSCPGFLCQGIQAPVLGCGLRRNASVCLFALILFHVLKNPFDLLMPPPIYSALALQLKEVTSSFIVMP